jgi:hypothetical protein
MLPFWVSIAALSFVQAGTVALPGALSRWRRASSWWAALPPASVLLFVVIARTAPGFTTSALTYIALVGVPIGAALALGWLARGARPWRAALALPLFALAWADRTGVAGEAAAVALSALSCVALGVLLAALTPPRWLAVGIVLMACADTALVASELLQRPNDVLNAAHPVGELPALQRAAFGSALIGYGDLFVAGVLGGLLAATGPPRRQRRGALLVAVLALSFDLLFFALDELPATVPVALALVVIVAFDRAGRPSFARRVLPDGGASLADAPRERSRALPLDPRSYARGRGRGPDERSPPGNR